MENPASDIKTVELSIYLPYEAVKVLGMVAEKRFLKRAQLIRQIILQEIQENPEYATDTDTIRSLDADNSDTTLGDK